MMVVPVVYIIYVPRSSVCGSGRILYIFVCISHGPQFSAVGDGMALAVYVPSMCSASNRLVH